MIDAALARLQKSATPENNRGAGPVWSRATDRLIAAPAAFAKEKLKAAVSAQCLSAAAHVSSATTSEPSDVQMPVATLSSATL